TGKRRTPREVAGCSVNESRAPTSETVSSWDGRIYFLACVCDALHTLAPVAHCHPVRRVVVRLKPFGVVGWSTEKVAGGRLGPMFWQFADGVGWAVGLYRQPARGRVCSTGTWGA
ncbi:unnamed protein product, partial [Hapterophycus canaliculatus]